MTSQTTTIPKTWKSAPIKDVVDVVIDNRGRNPEYYVSQGIPVIDNVLIKGERKIDLGETRRFIDEETYSSFIRKYNQKNDVLITLVGNGYGNVALSPEARSIIMQNTIGLRCNDTGDNIFLFYNLLLNKRSLTDLNIGAAQPSIKVGDLLNVELNFPPFPEQCAIATVLSSLDDKIELLREQNKTLEATAQAIFKEWFVNFNFPGATGKKIDSELGEIPEGWKVEKITDIFDFIKGSEPGSTNYSTERLSGNHVPFYRVQDISQYGDIPSIYVEEKLLKGKMFGADDILVSLDGTIGRVFIGGSGGYSGGIRRVLGRKDFIKKSLIFCFLKSPKFQNDLESFSGAETTIKHAGGAIEHIKFALNDDVCVKFGETFDPLFYKVISNITQIQTLSALRDALLPKLMKGEVRVAGFKE